MAMPMAPRTVRANAEVYSPQPRPMTPEAARTIAPAGHSAGGMRRVVMTITAISSA